MSPRPNAQNGFKKEKSKRKKKHRKSPKPVPSNDIIVLDSEDDLVPRQSFSSSDGSRWFNTSEIMTLSDEDEYEKMADELVDEQSGSSIDGLESCFCPSLPMTPVQGPSRISAVVPIEECSVFSSYEAVIANAKLSADGGRPQTGDHRDAFPCKGPKKRGKTLFTTMVKSRSEFSMRGNSRGSSGSRGGRGRSRVNVHEHGDYSPYNSRRGSFKRSSGGHHHSPRTPSYRGMPYPHMQYNRSNGSRARH
ncbi:hypothetical protein L596_019996 [Steinernema carpocapsae]|uniref:Uncharacterized protein n=1 Tax=Steinernema carpocapsae TaxID=34508 RepID=A0A4U5MS95_STECR|nr:hypothetical protein L596_019996 [Steinernema carpocapsae]